jgi:hypothetical protein
MAKKKLEMIAEELRTLVDRMNQTDQKMSMIQGAMDHIMQMASNFGQLGEDDTCPMEYALIMEGLNLSFDKVEQEQNKICSDVERLMLPLCKSTNYEVVLNLALTKEELNKFNNDDYTGAML